MNEEKLQVLKMIEEGKITAEEGIKLLAAVEQRDWESVEGERKAKYLYIRVEDLHTGRKKVNLKVPFFLVNFGMKFLPKEAEGVTQRDLERVIEIARHGGLGEVLEVVDDEDGIKVKMWVE
ncbi:SHOCT-like domain-containing protein [Anaerobranca gottschalkii]|uniref:YvlB/LiaX N-terminal domain-containing protein n=1 Tax=Anaerobranca gottschalkii DSM 13577 TaxID=1120990 RepID=A0A1I0CGZ5_9FIRM|nr:hypothetical protein [Anaerobranca gottschalkii]SET18376.1 hypothetical protein SAMN03080614_10727 [Anaerobranca gottschalkii DSM 13577]